MKSNLGDKPRLQHIYDAILEIENYIGESTYESFQSNSMMQYASVKQLEIIDLRNLLIHEYFGMIQK